MQVHRTTSSAAATTTRQQQQRQLENNNNNKSNGNVAAYTSKNFNLQHQKMYKQLENSLHFMFNARLVEYPVKSDKQNKDMT